MGQRDRTADARQQPASPFALLVESADTPPPPTKDRGESAAAKRTSTTDETAAGRGPAPKDSSAPASNPPKQDEPTTAPAVVPADAKAATGSEAPPEVALPTTGEPDTKTSDTVEVATPATTDTSTAQPTTQTPTVAAAPVAPAAPMPAAVVVPAQAALATPAGNDGDGADDATAGLTKSAPTPPLPAGEPQPADVPAAGPPQTGAPKKDKAATTAATDTQPPASIDAPSADGKDANTDASGKIPTPAQPTPSDSARPTDQHARPRGRDEAQKLDDLLSQPLGAQVNAAAHGAKPPTEAMQAVLQAADGLAGAATAAATAAAPSASQATLDPAVPIAGLAVEIATRAQAGSSRFEIRLDPPELGRIDVRLDVDNSGQVTSRLVVDRPETLEHLRRDASELERALQQAGLKTADNGLQFTLRDQGGGFAGRDDSRTPTAPARLIVPDSNAAPIDALQAGYGRTVRVGGLDISV